MKRTVGIAVAVVTALSLLAAGAQAQRFQRVIVPAGARILLRVDQARVAPEMRPGLPVRMHVARDFLIGPRLVVPAGTRVFGAVRRDFFRQGCVDRVVRRPVRTGLGVQIPLLPLPVRDVFALGRPLRWRTNAEVRAIVARPVAIPWYGRR